MARFLSSDWIAEMDAAAAGVTLPGGADLTIRQVIVAPDGEQAWTLRLSGTRLSVSEGDGGDADVTLTEDAATAAALARGEMSAQVALMRGLIRVAGDVRAVVAAVEVLGALGDPFAAVRATTTFPA